MNINKNQIKPIRGKQNKIWQVVQIGDKVDEYAVQEHNTNEDANVVTYNSEEEHCEGTYFQYNETCPHIEAVRQWDKIQNVSIKSNTKAVEEMDFFSAKSCIFVDESGSYVLVKHDGNVGYVDFRLTVENEYVRIDSVKYHNIAGDNLENYGYYDLDRVYKIDDFGSDVFERYIEFESYVKYELSELMYEAISDNEGDIL